VEVCRWMDYISTLPLPIPMHDSYFTVPRPHTSHSGHAQGLREQENQGIQHLLSTFDVPSEAVEALQTLDITTSRARPSLESPFRGEGSPGPERLDGLSEVIQHRRVLHPSPLCAASPDKSQSVLQTHLSSSPDPTERRGGGESGGSAQGTGMFPRACSPQS